MTPALGRQRPLVQSAGPSPFGEAELTEPSTGSADLPLIGVEPLGEVGVRTSNTSSDLEQHSRRQRPGFKWGGLSGETLRPGGQLSGDLDDLEKAIDETPLVGARPNSPRDAFQVGLQPPQLRPVPRARDGRGGNTVDVLGDVRVITRHTPDGTSATAFCQTYVNGLFDKRLTSSRKAGEPALAHRP